MNFFQGRFTPKHPEKYMNKNGLQDIVFRSSWEKHVMIYFDGNKDIVCWGSEEIQIPYIDENDGKLHRYFIDFYAETSTGKKLLIEVKPLCQTQPPTRGKGMKEHRYLMECSTYVKNISKWVAAKAYAERNGMLFQVWTENQIEQLGINIINKKKYKPFKKFVYRKKSRKCQKTA